MKSLSYWLTRLILIALALLLVFFLSSRVKFCCTEDFSTIFCIAYLRISRGNAPGEFTLDIYPRNLPWLFSAKICLGCLPWVFCILKRISFCMCEQILFKWKQIFFICEQNCLICEIFFINSISFYFCRGSYGPSHIPHIFVL